MPIKIIQAKSLLTKSNIPGVDYCLNPYVGCLHGCVYCYARFMKRFTNHLEPWGQFLDVKINAPEVLEKDLEKNPKRGPILLGSVTDVYQPLEKKYQLTRDLLKILLRYDWPISILTKSDLVTRDIDLLKQFSDCEVGLSLATLDEKIAQAFDPGASSPAKRLVALDELHQAGIKTYVFISPVLPGLTDLESIFKVLVSKIDFIMAESLNLKTDNWPDIKRVLTQKYPHLMPIYQARFDRGYWDKVEAELERLSQDTGIPLTGFYRHEKGDNIYKR